MCGCVPIKVYLWTLKLEFLLIFSYHKIFLFCLLFQLLQNVKTIPLGLTKTSSRGLCSKLTRKPHKFEHESKSWTSFKSISLNLLPEEIFLYCIRQVVSLHSKHLLLRALLSWPSML